MTRRARTPMPRRRAAPLGSGRVVQVNVSPGGVPKHAVSGTWVGRLGLEGDAQASPGVHGGPHRAVALFAIEAIRRVAAEGHAIGPGSAGENLTTEGVELATLAPGTQARLPIRLGARDRLARQPLRHHPGQLQRREVRAHLDPQASARQPDVRARPARGCGRDRRRLPGLAAPARLAGDGAQPRRAPRDERTPLLAGDLGGRGGCGRRPARPGSRRPRRLRRACAARRPLQRRLRPAARARVARSGPGALPEQRR